MMGGGRLGCIRGGEVKSTTTANEGVEVVNGMTMKISEKPSSRGKRDLKRRGENKINRPTEVASRTKEDEDTIGEVGIRIISSWRCRRGRKTRAFGSGRVGMMKDDETL